MPWFRVDSDFHEHPKVLLLRDNRHGTAAIALWLYAGCWCNRHATNGHVPRHLLRLLQFTPAAAKALVEVGLWEVAPKGWMYKDWLDYQPSADDIKERREAWRERQQRRRSVLREDRKSRRDTPRDTLGGVTGGVTSFPIPIPDPDPKILTPPPTHSPSSLQDVRARERVREGSEGSESKGPGTRTESLLSDWQPATQDPDEPEGAWSCARMQLVFQREYLRSRGVYPNMRTRDGGTPRDLHAAILETAKHRAVEPETLLLQAIALWLPKAGKPGWPFAFFANAFSQVLAETPEDVQALALKKLLEETENTLRLVREGGNNANR